jgi:hypothetical protein
MGMENFLTRLIGSVFFLFMASCASRVDIVEHHISPGYEGWILILFEGKPEEGNINDSKLVYYYDELGVAINPDKITYDWREDRFYYPINSSGSSLPKGEIETSGFRYYNDRSSSYYYISGWVGRKPSEGRMKHLENAIMRTEKGVD